MNSKGSVLQPDDNIKILDNGQEKLINVIEALKMKHPSPRLPHSLALLPPDNLPALEDLDITGGHVHHVAHRIQGSAGLVDATHLTGKILLLHYGTSSSRLWDSISDLAHRVANSIIDWPLLQGLLASHLIALDKCPGIRPIGIGEVLRRVIGTTICLLTRDDAESVCGSV